ncbi:MAG: DNA cytosine methyltransferase [Longimicrobiales bacterium]|nr:DNA cytosine methyltransferase [Longimicrobiales bacterium]
MGSSELRAVELFAGGGGMALGTDRAGFHHVALLERNRHAVDTLVHNAKSGTGVRADLPIEITDVTEFDYSRIEESIDLLAGGAPCQPFSLGGKHAGQKDRRNLFPEVFRAQRALQPRAVLLENVRGLARKAFRPYLEYILLQLALPGIKPMEGEGWRDHKDRLFVSLERDEFGDAPTYHVKLGLRECADFGLPQRRGRVFMIAIRTDHEDPLAVPRGSHAKERLIYDQFKSGAYWDRHGLPQPHPNGHRVPELAPSSQPWRTVRDTLRHLPVPSDGVAHSCHPNHVGVPGAKSYPGHTGSPWDEPAKALKAGVHGVPGGENMLRDDDGAVRYFTVHEAALLQGFPEEYEFCGSRSEAMRQIGNAAPTPVCEEIANAIRIRLEDEDLSVGGYTSPHVDLVHEKQLAIL